MSSIAHAALRYAHTLCPGAFSSSTRWRATLIRQRLDDLVVEHPLVAGDNRARHAVRHAVLAAQLADPPAHGMRVSATDAAVAGGWVRVHPLVQRQQVGEAVAQDAKEEVTLLVG